MVFCSGSPSYDRALTKEPPVSDWPRADTYISFIRQVPSLLELGAYPGKVQSVLITCKPESPGVIIFRRVSVEMNIKVAAWTAARMRKRRGSLPELLTASSSFLSLTFQSCAVCLPLGSMKHAHIMTANPLIQLNLGTNYFYLQP